MSFLFNRPKSTEEQQPEARNPRRKTIKTRKERQFWPVARNDENRHSMAREPHQKTLSPEAEELSREGLSSARYSQVDLAATIPATSQPAIWRTEDPYSFLASFNTTLLIDDSESMAGRSWREVMQALSIIAPIVTKYNPEGITIYFLNHKSSDPGAGFRGGIAPGGYRRIFGADAINKIFGRVTPGGGTPIGVRMDNILKPYLAKLESDIADGIETKALNLIVLTDGVPSDDVESVLLSAANQLDKFYAPPLQIGIQFFQIGNEEACQLKWDTDIVDAVTRIDERSSSDGVIGPLFGESILKAVLDIVAKRFEQILNRRHSSALVEQGSPVEQNLPIERIPDGRQSATLVKQNSLVERIPDRRQSSTPVMHSTDRGNPKFCYTEAQTQVDESQISIFSAPSIIAQQHTASRNRQEELSQMEIKEKLRQEMISHTATKERLTAVGQVVQKLNQEIEDKDDDLEDFKGEIASKNTAINLLEARCAGYNEVAKKLKEESASQSQKIQRLQNIIDERGSQLADIVQRFNLKEEEIKGLKARAEDSAAQYQNDIARLKDMHQQEARKSKIEVERYRNNASYQGDQIKSLKEIIAHKDAEFQALGERSTVLAVKIQAHTAEIIADIQKSLLAHSK